jgi:DNA-binding PadR family transcriptional regulator
LLGLTSLSPTHPYSLRKKPYIGLLYIVDLSTLSPVAIVPTKSEGLGKNPGVSALILTSLAGGDKHGYALVKDVDDFASVELQPGTLYEALARLERLGLIEALASDDRRRPYRLTSAGAAVLSEYLATQRRVVKAGLSRLSQGWSFS